MHQGSNFKWLEHATIELSIDRRSSFMCNYFEHLLFYSIFKVGINSQLRQHTEIILRMRVYFAINSIHAPWTCGFACTCNGYISHSRTRSICMHPYTSTLPGELAVSDRARNSGRFAVFSCYWIFPWQSCRFYARKELVRRFLLHSLDGRFIVPVPELQVVQLNISSTSRNPTMTVALRILRNFS